MLKVLLTACPLQQEQSEERHLTARGVVSC